MNWEFHAVTSTDSTALIEEYRTLAIEGLEQWLLEPERMDKQGEAGYSEFPPGFFHEGPSYRFRYRVWGPGGCLDPAEYDVSVQQTFYPKFDQEVWLKAMSRKRLRFIQNMESIT